MELGASESHPQPPWRMGTSASFLHGSHPNVTAATFNINWRTIFRVQVPPEGLGGEFVLPEIGLGGSKTSSGWSWTLRVCIDVAKRFRHRFWLRRHGLVHVGPGGASPDPDLGA